MVSGFVWLTTVEVGCVAFLNRSTWGAHARDTYDAAHACNEARNVADGVAVFHSHRAGVGDGRTSSGDAKILSLFICWAYSRSIDQASCVAVYLVPPCPSSYIKCQTES